MRWLTTLYAREFSMEDTFRIWDSLLSDPKRFMFMHCIGTAMIANKKEQLMKASFADTMSLLQNYECPPITVILTTANSIRIKLLRREKEGEKGEKEEEESTGMRRNGRSVRRRDDESGRRAGERCDGPGEEGVERYEEARNSAAEQVW